MSNHRAALSSHYVALGSKSQQRQTGCEFIEFVRCKAWLSQEDLSLLEESNHQNICVPLYDCLESFTNIHAATDVMWKQYNEAPGGICSPDSTLKMTAGQGKRADMETIGRFHSYQDGLCSLDIRHSMQDNLLPFRQWLFNSLHFPSSLPCTLMGSRISSEPNERMFSQSCTSSFRQTSPSSWECQPVQPLWKTIQYYAVKLKTH